MSVLSWINEVVFSCLSLETILERQKMRMPPVFWWGFWFGVFLCVSECCPGEWPLPGRAGWLAARV